MKKAALGKVLKITGLVVAAVLVVAIALLSWLAWAGSGPTKEKIAKALPLPIAFVGGRPISAAGFYGRVESAEQFYASQPGTDAAAIRRQVFDAMVNEERIRILAEEKNIRISKPQIEEQYGELTRALADGDAEKFSQMVKDYGLGPDEFKKQVVGLELLKGELATWFAGQRDLNASAYASLDRVQTDMQAGATLESLAAKYSQDEGSKNLEGDVGFVELGQLLPEFRRSLDGVQDGQTRLVVTRFGLHLVTVESRDNNGTDGRQRVHLRQIFIRTGDAQAWMQKESAKYKVRQLVQI